MGRKRMRQLEGISGSPGVAIGQAVCIGGRRAEVFRFPLEPEQVGNEIERLHQAVRRAGAELEATRKKARRQLGKELAAIFEAHLLVLEDRAFLGGIEQRIADELVNAEWAVHETSEEMQLRFERFEVRHLRDRSEDIRDVAQHLLRALAGIDHHEFSELGGEVVIVTDDLTPSEAVRLGREQVLAFVLERGGVTSHTTIIARSLHIPLVAGLAGVTDLVTDADPVVVDGRAGVVILHPTQKTLKEYRAVQRRLEAREGELERIRALPTITLDGEHIELLANIDLPEEIGDAVRHGAMGVGLYRSEFLFIEKSPEMPSEDEHVELYTSLLEEIGPHPVVVRTFDLGGRKLARQILDKGREENPVLGLRGIRLTLARPEVFKSQLRALYRAGTRGDLRILLPMVSSVEEVQEFKALADEVVEELEREGLPHAAGLKIGAMIEVPAAALVADSLAREVDFLSIGTNDLIQYAMAVDRSNQDVSYLYRPVHPAILRMIRFTVDSARAVGIDVSLCGEMGADPRYAPLLAGIGLRSLSVTPRAIPEIKQLLRGISAEDWRQRTERCLAMHTADEVEELLSEALEAPPPAVVGRSR